MNNDDKEFIIINGNIISKNDMRNCILKEMSAIKDEIKGRHFEKNDTAIAQFNDIVSTLQSHLQNDSCSIDVEMFTPTLSMGSITITGECINISASIIKEVLNAASEMEIAPYSDGSVSIIFGFNDLMVLR